MGTTARMSMRRRTNNKWYSRQDFRLQLPRSKRGVLYIELREHENWCGRLVLP